MYDRGIPKEKRDEINAGQPSAKATPSVELRLCEPRRAPTALLIPGDSVKERSRPNARRPLLIRKTGNLQATR
jgi:hypothetical protein